MKMGKERAIVMKKTVKAIYILIVAIVVFTGALLIIKGLEESRYDDAAIAVIYSGDLFDNEEGSAL